MNTNNTNYTNSLLHFIRIHLYIGIIICAVGFPFKLGSAIISQDGTPFQSLLKKFPQGYFVEPTDSSLKIAGNFGEIRPNHFHAGLDVKTGGREGVYIFSVADGYVSRIKISPYGYGKCLYITHPNGYVTVYAHLQRFYGKIAKYVEQEQYKAEEYAIEVLPDSNLLRVKQCDTVAISGNTGGSQSPHLHFEVRDEKTENAYNPFLFGYKIEDTVPPKLVTLAVYPVNDSSYLNGKNVSRKTKVYGSKGKYKIAPAERITVSGDIGFGIETYDYANIPQAGKLGAYSVDMYIDGQRIYYHELNEISFDESRYINSLIDYKEIGNSRKEIQKCFREENNMLSIYQCMVNEGIFRFDDDLSHPVKFIVKDFFGNTSELNFQVKSQKLKITSSLVARSSSLVPFRCSNENIFETKDVKVEIPPCTLYEDIDFNYSMSKDTLHGKFAPIHTVHKPDVPLHATYTLSIKTKPIPEKLQSKATIVLLDGKNNMTAILPTILRFRNTTEGCDRRSTEKGRDGEGFWVSAETQYFGHFTVAMDTVAPTIQPYTIYNGKNMKSAQKISVIISDNLTGIKSYRATIDGKWILMEYEPKKAMLFYEFPRYPILPVSDSGIRNGETEKGRKGEVRTGKHTFGLTVTDGKNNVRTYKADFFKMDY